MKKFKLIMMGVVICLVVLGAWVAGFKGAVAMSVILLTLSIPFFLIYFTVILPIRWSEVNE